MTNPDHEHVRILVADAVSPGWEEVPARRLEGDEWELLRSPLYATGLASGDVVRAKTDQGRGEFLVLRRGGNVCVQFYLAAKDANDADATRSVAEVLRSLLTVMRGTVDGHTPGLIACTIPVVAGFPAIEGVFHDAAGRFPGSQWQFANVFDFDTGQPLNWWYRFRR